MRNAELALAGLVPRAYSWALVKPSASGSAEALTPEVVPKYWFHHVLGSPSVLSLTVTRVIVAVWLMVALSVVTRVWVISPK